MPSFLLLYLFRVHLRLFPRVLRFGARRFDQQNVPHRRGQISHWLRRESRFQRDLVQALQFALAVRFGLGHHRRRRAAGSSVLFGAAGDTSELSAASLHLCASAAPVVGPLARARVLLLSVASNVRVVWARYFEASAFSEDSRRLGVFSCGAFQP